MIIQEQKWEESAKKESFTEGAKQHEATRLCETVADAGLRIRPDFAAGAGALWGSQQSRMGEADVFHTRLSPGTALALVGAPRQSGAFSAAGDPGRRAVVT